MNLDKVNSLASRVFFVTSFALLTIAVLERFAVVVGYTLTQPFYSAGRLLEFAAIFVLFVVALVLRQIREELKRRV